MNMTKVLPPPLAGAKHLILANKYPISIVLTGVFFGVLGTIPPFIIDDWFWGTHSISLKQLINNDMRLLGNLSVMIMAGSHSHLLVGLFHGVALAVICHFVMKLCRTKSISSLIFFIALLLLVDKQIFTETMMWTAGFANYIIPFAFLLPVVWRITTNKQVKVYEYFLYSFLIFASVFFLENLSSTVLLFLIGSTIYAIKRHQQPLFKIIITCVQAFGFLLMFCFSERTKTGGASGYTMDILGASKLDFFAHTAEVVEFIYNFSIIPNLPIFIVVIGLFLLLLILCDRGNCEIQISKIVKVSVVFTLFGAVTILQFFLISAVNGARISFPCIFSVIVLGVYLFGNIRKNLMKSMKILSVLLLLVALLFQYVVQISTLVWRLNIEDQVSQVNEMKTDSIVYEVHREHNLDDFRSIIISERLIHSEKGFCAAFRDFFNIPDDVKVCEK